MAGWELATSLSVWEFYSFNSDGCDFWFSSVGLSRFVLLVQHSLPSLVKYDTLCIGLSGLLKDRRRQIVLPVYPRFRKIFCSNFLTSSAFVLSFKRFCGWVSLLTPVYRFKYSPDPHSFVTLSQLILNFIWGMYILIICKNYISPLDRILLPWQTLASSEACCFNQSMINCCKRENNVSMLKISLNHRSLL